MLNAKEYLMRLRNMDLKINAKQYEVEQLRLMATCIGGFNNDGIDVQKSKTGDTLERKVAKYVDLENEINDDIDTLIRIKHTVIDEIHSLQDSRYIELLFKRYVEFKSFEQISVEMNYEYGTVRNLHIDSLEAFQEEILSKKNINDTK